MIVRRDEKLRLISHVPLFEACSQPALARIAAITAQVEVPEGDVLIREGEPGDLFFVLVKGTAEVRKGKRRVATLRAGDFAGELALLTNAPRTATVRTTSSVRDEVLNSKSDLRWGQMSFMVQLGLVPEEPRRPDCERERHP